LADELFDRARAHALGERAIGERFVFSRSGLGE
jgi:hypothetical protein